MRRFFALILLFAAGRSLAIADPFLFDGFYLGMPRAEAAKVRPELAWKIPTAETPSATIRKEFTSSHLGREAHVSVGLDGAGQFVRLIGFAFEPKPGTPCLLDAVGVRMQLERRYGTAAEITSEDFGKRARWLTADGMAVRWVEACAVGTGQYFVTYAKPAD